MSSNNKSEKMKLASFRSINDFLLDTRRYSPPTFNDLKRFNNRVISNLLYYQTNYFGLSVLTLTLFMLFQSGRMIVGASGVAITVLDVLFSLDRIPQASSLRAQYPLSVYGAWFLNIVIVYSAFRSVLFFALAVLVPILFWILHASMRSRGLKNKVNNKMEQLGAAVYANTPMEYIVTALGLEAKDFDE